MAGNENSGRRKERLFYEALCLEIKSRNDSRGLRAIASTLVDMALEGELPAIKELADRLDGKPAQAFVGPDDENGMPTAMIIRVVDVPANRD
jgi:hypothetical protein